MITIVDYGVGNVNAIANMLKKIGAQCVITGKEEELQNASKIILPGVGAFDTALSELKKRNLEEVLHQKAKVQKVPVLGICLGMQLLTNGSEEGQLKGFGWIPAFTYKFNAVSGLKVPHMQWNHVEQMQESALTNDLEPQSKFYFVHSYYVKTENKEHALLQAEYGVPFDAAVQNENIYGVQFHPEKSHKYGLRILSNFASL